MVLNSNSPSLHVFRIPLAGKGRGGRTSGGILLRARARCLPSCNSGSSAPPKHRPTGEIWSLWLFPQHAAPLPIPTWEKSPESSTSTPRARNTYCLFSGDKILFLKYTESEFPRGPPPPRCVHDAGQPPPPELLHETKDGHYTLRARQKTPL